MLEVISSADSEHVRRVALAIQYLGTHYYGWQRQPSHPSVQQTIEEAIAQISIPQLSQSLLSQLQTR